jgi:hypothetical protein
MYRTTLLIALLTALLGCSQQNKIEPRLPGDAMPVMGCWFWNEAVFEPDGYKPFIDAVSKHSPYNFLTTSIRAPKVEVTEKNVHAQIKAAAKYAMSHGVPIIMDLDVRLARRAFEAEYPDELQQMLLLEEVDLSPKNSVETVIKSHDLSDHYTHNTTHYIPLHGSLLRVYAYDRGANGIEPQTLQDITEECHIVSANKDSVHVQIPSNKKTKACLMVAFTHLTPDVFAPHLIQFQHEIIEQYSDVPLAGVCKDEWGFPPNFDGNPQKNQFWYSKHRALAYKERTNGHDLLADCLLMHAEIQGQADQRIRAINHFMEMSLQRNAELEDAFYDVVKIVFGADAVVATHPTWWPYPDLREFKKNGLDWWAATRDWAQTDELTPFAARTALSKKWNSAVWYNMYYSKEIADYERSLWSAALGGGRINYHQLYPVKNPKYPRVELLQGDLMHGESRVRLLNFISKSPLDCQVAVIFGHTCAMNWAGPSYDDVGMDVVNKLWSDGFPTDLIPSSEIENKSLYIDEDGWICYGPQRYAAVLLYHPEFEKQSTAAFFDRAKNGPTTLFRVGDWTRDFEGQKVVGNSVLPERMLELYDVQLAVSEISATLKGKKIAKQTPATSQLDGFGHTSSSPPTTGLCRLIDGTVIQIAGTNNVAGDPIQSTIKIKNFDITFDAIGVGAVRLDGAGNVRAMAAGGLAIFNTADFEIRLDQRADIALWIDEHDHWTGVLQGWQGAIPKQLLQITKNWIRLDVPAPL